MKTVETYLITYDSFYTSNYAWGVYLINYTSNKGEEKIDKLVITK